MEPWGCVSTVQRSSDDCVGVRGGSCDCAPPLKAGSQAEEPVLEEKPLFKLVNGQLDLFAREFHFVSSSMEFKIDDATMDELTLPTIVDLNRLKIGLLMFHYCSFHRRIRVPLMRPSWFWNFHSCATTCLDHCA